MYAHKDIEFSAPLINHVKLFVLLLQSNSRLVLG